MKGAIAAAIGSNATVWSGRIGAGYYAGAVDYFGYTFDGTSYYGSIAPDPSYFMGQRIIGIFTYEAFPGTNILGVSFAPAPDFSSQFKIKTTFGERTLVYTVGATWTTSIPSGEMFVNGNNYDISLYRTV